MTQHHITGSEAFGPRPHVEVRYGSRRRRMYPAIKVYGLFGGMGIVAGLADVALDAPIALIVVLVGIAAWRFWPSGQ